MSEPAVLPDPDSVYSLFTGIYKPQLVRIALRLDVFTPLASGPADAQAVAQACGCSSSGIRILLDYLTSIGILERHGDHYALTPTASTFLVPKKRSYVGDLILGETSAEIEEGYLQAVRSGVPSDPCIPWAQDAWLESYSSSRPAKSLEMWRLAGFEPGRTAPLRIVDLACGCAIKSLTLAQADPMVQIRCIDSPDVLEVARDLAKRLGVLSQVVFLPGDLHSVDLGKGQYQAALLGQITFYLTPEQNTALLGCVLESLVSGGILVIDVPMISDISGDWDHLISFFTWAISGGKAYSFDEYRHWLEAAGFEGVKQLGKSWLSAQKP